jgi:peptidoglycan/LPS O-acetylase OafA/YrhL/glycosyltransferase involved in cell wall biosynthesis
MIVFLAHAGLGERIPGTFGVTVFFFLSGYLITTLLRLEYEATGSISLRQFYLRRVLRILPPMYLVLGLAVVATLSGVLAGQLEPVAVLAQVFHLTNYYNIQAGMDGQPFGTGVYWSLAVEEHFYLVFPLLYLVLRGRLRSSAHQALVLGSLCLAILAWRCLLVYGLGASGERTAIATDTRLDSILFGCLLAIVGNPFLDAPSRPDRRWQVLWLPLGLVVIAATFLIRDSLFRESFRYTLQGLALIPVFVTAIRRPDWGPFRLLNARPVRFLGVLSYSIYLSHQVVIYGVWQWSSWHPLLQGVLSLSLTIVLAAAIHVWIEKPCARLRKRWSPLARPAESPADRNGAQIGVGRPHRFAQAYATQVTIASNRHSGERIENVISVSAVICTRNRPDLIGNAVASVVANTYPRFDLLVVDQSDDDRTGAIVRELAADHPNLRYLHTSTPGLSRAYNIGIRETQGELLAFTDDDCIAPMDWISSIEAAFGSTPEAEMLYGQVLLPKSLEDCADEVPTLAIHAPQRLSRRDGFRIYGMGANFAARRRLFARVGGFDELLGGGGPLKSSQDFDFQYRAYVAGAVVLLRPDVKVDHYGVRNASQWQSTLRSYGFGDGAFYSKHVRCGDLYATSMLIRRLGRIAAREALNGVRRKPTLAPYLWSAFAGMREGLRFPVDRRQRLYLQERAAS